MRDAEKMVKQEEGRADTLSVAVEKSTTYMNKAGNRETDMREDRSEIVGRRARVYREERERRRVVFARIAMSRVWVCNVADASA